MNIESTATTVAKTNEVSTSSTASSNVSSTKDNSKTFKDELQTVKSQDPKVNEENKSNESEITTLDNKSEITKNTQVNAKENIAQQAAKDKLLTENNKDKNDEDSAVSNPLNELSSKIAALNEIKGLENTKTQSIGKKNDEIKPDKNDYCQTIKMDNKDITFFVNLVENQQMTAQAVQTNTTGTVNNNFTEIKTEATQSTIQVSQTLLDALNESAKTGKPFRIDFDGDVAVIMKVDKQGILSANFIPGSAAVENYLRNNIESLRQNFNEQNLPYNQLSYSNQQKQKQQNNQKENENE